MAVSSVVCPGFIAQHSHTKQTRNRSHPPRFASSANEAKYKLRHRSATSDGRSHHVVGHRTRITSIKPVKASGHHCQSDKDEQVAAGCHDNNNSEGRHCHDEAQCHGIVTELVCHHCNISHTKQWHVASPITKNSTCCRQCPAPAIYMVVWSGHVTHAVHLYVYDDLAQQSFTHYRVYAVCRSDSDDDEIDDKALNNILIVTQTPPYMKKHPQGDRHPNPDFIPRAKMTQEIAKMINDGLCYYEEELWDDTDVRDLTLC